MTNSYIHQVLSDSLFVVGKRVLWQLVESHPVRIVVRWYWATWCMARDGTWVLVDAGW